MTQEGSPISDHAAVHVSGELFAPVSPGVELCYQTFGDTSDEPLLLVMGLGGPMIWWDTGFCEQLAAAGFHVVRYDNRDTGRSSHGRGRVTRLGVVRAFLGRRDAAPYDLTALADDAMGLMDHLGTESAHVVGISMGGMIAQTLALNHPGRVRSLTSIMSNTGRRTAGWTDPRLFPQLLARRTLEREAYADTSADFWELIGSPGYPQPREEHRRKALETFDRGLNPPGVLRHMAAVLTQPDRTKALSRLRVPTLVVHGLADRMVHVSGGRATADAVPGSELLLLEGLGHELPPETWGTVVEAIRRTADRAG